MAEKCFLCGKKIEEIFLGKKKGTVVKIGEKGKNKIYYICDDCQKKFKNKVKEEVLKKLRK